MKRLDLIVYRYKPHLKEDDYRALTKLFLEHGTNDGVLAQYERLDGKGGYIIEEGVSEDAKDVDFERTLIYGAYLDFEIVPIVAMEEAIPSILKMFG